MRCIANNGLRFSFDKKNSLEENLGSETPRFAEVETDSKHHRRVKNNKKRQQFDRELANQLRFSFERKQNISLPSRESPLSQVQKAKAAARQSELQIGYTGYLREEDSRSVRSVQSLKQRLANRSTNKRMLEIKKRILSNNTRSLASLLQKRKDGLQQRQPKNTGRAIQNQTQFQGSWVRTPHKWLAKQQGSSSQVEKSEQSSKSSSKNRLGQYPLNLLGHWSEQKRPGRSFKGMFHRGKPMLQLQIHQGVQNNQKIENISKAFEEFKEAP